MKNTRHEEKPIRNFFYALLCIFTSIAFVGFWCSVIFEKIPYRDDIFVVCSVILAVAVIMGIITPLFKILKKR